MSDERDSFRLVLTTAGSDEQAETIARALVERRLAACVNLVNDVCSIYRWQGEVTREAEKLLLIKTVASRCDEVRATIRELHSYDVPEVLVLPVDNGDPDYLRWVAESVRPT